MKLNPAKIKKFIPNKTFISITLLLCLVYQCFAWYQAGYEQGYTAGIAWWQTRLRSNHQTISHEPCNPPYKVLLAVNQPQQPE